MWMNSILESSTVQDSWRANLKNMGFYTTCICPKPQVEGAVGTTDGKKKGEFWLQSFSVSPVSPQVPQTLRHKQW